jgi:hypothetical protein
MAAFFSWPAPAPGAPIDEHMRPRPSNRSHALASLLALAIGLVLAAASMALPLVGAGGAPWTLGAHLTLFCHLI